MARARISGLDNDDLVDKLKEANRIKTGLIERVFRAVDRGEYFLPAWRGNAYEERAWKNGNIHISSPCIYSAVMENLYLYPGFRFLNIGSGTGYLSTMVGLIIGTNGVNHGIELHADVLKYAREKLAEFKKKTAVLQSFEFCEPTFVEGNGLLLPRADFNQYDRVYCGAGCTENDLNYFKDLIKIGGMLVLPVQNRLLRLTRVSQTQWNTVYLMRVKFSILQLPNDQSTPPSLHGEIQFNTASGHGGLLDQSEAAAPTPGCSATTEVIDQPSSASLNPQMMRLLETIEEAWRCPVCLDVVNPPLVSCVNGHLSCKRCSTRLNDCSLCRSPFSIIHLRSVEQVLGVLPRKCKHAEYGCADVHLLDDMEYCEYRKMKCPGGSGMCPWNDSVKDWWSHASTEHWAFAIPQPPVTITCRDSHCFKFDNGFILLKCSKGERFTDLTAQQIPTSKPNHRYFLQISISKEGSLLMSGKIRAVVEEEQSMRILSTDICDADIFISLLEMPV